MTPSTQEIWENFSDNLGAYILKRVNNPEDAEDILQDVFLKIHNRIATLQDNQRLASWLFQITRNTIIDHYRKQRPWFDLPKMLVEEESGLDVPPGEQLAGSLREFMNCLPDKYYQALVLAELEGLSQKELAINLGLSLSGAKSRVQRGRTLLRHALLDCCHFEFDRRGAIKNYTPRQDCCQD